jgi:hypothetical protein
MIPSGMTYFKINVSNDLLAVASMNTASVHCRLETDHGSIAVIRTNQPAGAAGPVL